MQTNKMIGTQQSSTSRNVLALVEGHSQGYCMGKIIRDPSPTGKLWKIIHLQLNVYNEMCAYLEDREECGSR